MKSYREVLEVIADLFIKSEYQSVDSIAEMYYNEAVGMCKMAGFIFGIGSIAVQRDAMNLIS